MVESRYQNATQSHDSEQIEDMPCPFKNISIPCKAATQVERSLYRNRVELLSEKCNTGIHLYLGYEESRYSAVNV